MPKLAIPRHHSLKLSHFKQIGAGLPEGIITQNRLDGMFYIYKVLPDGSLTLIKKSKVPDFNWSDLEKTKEKPSHIEHS